MTISWLKSLAQPSWRSPSRLAVSWPSEEPGRPRQGVKSRPSPCRMPEARQAVPRPTQRTRPYGP